MPLLAEGQSSIEYWKLAVSILNIGVILFSAILIWRQLKTQSGQLELQRKSHFVTSLETLSDVWESERMLRVRQAAARSLQSLEPQMRELPDWSKTKPINAEIEYILEFFDRIGAYQREGALEADPIWEVFSWRIEYYYAMIIHDLERIREEEGDPLIYNNFEHVAKLMLSKSKKVLKKDPPALDRERWPGFLEAELDVVDTIIEVSRAENATAKAELDGNHTGA